MAKIILILTHYIEIVEICYEIKGLNLGYSSIKQWAGLFQRPLTISRLLFFSAVIIYYSFLFLQLFLDPLSKEV